MYLELCHAQLVVMIMVVLVVMIMAIFTYSRLTSRTSVGGYVPYLRSDTLADFGGSCIIPQKGTMPPPDALKDNLQSANIAILFEHTNFHNNMIKSDLEDKKYAIFMKAVGPS